MPDNNDYLSQLMSRADRRLGEPEAEEKTGPDNEPANAPVKPRVFTSGGRFDDVPSSDVGQEASAAEEVNNNTAPEESEYAEEDPAVIHEEHDEEHTVETDKATFSFSAESESIPQAQNGPDEDEENVFDWNVSEDVEKYLTPKKGDSIFSDIPSEGKKSRKAKRAEKRRLKENTRQFMDKNSGEQRGCFSAFFHLLLSLALVALTILAVLYVMQTIADVTIIDVNKIISFLTQKVMAFIENITS